MSMVYFSFCVGVQAYATIVNRSILRYFLIVNDLKKDKINPTILIEKGLLKIFKVLESVTACFENTNYSPEEKDKV